MRVSTVSSLAVLASLGGCAAAPSPPLPARLTDVPWSRSEPDRAILAARALADRGRAREALAGADAVLATHPRHVDAQRLRQDLLRERGRLGRVAVEAEQRVADWQGDARALYLRGRVAGRDDAARRELFAAAVRRDPASFWGWLGLAFAHRNDDPERAIAIYDALYRRTAGHPLVGVGYAYALRRAEREDDALRIYADLDAADELPGVAALGAAETHAAAGRQREAFDALLVALRARPFDAGVRRLLALLVAAGLDRPQTDRLFAVLLADPAALRDLCADAAGAATVCELAQRAGHLPLARAALTSAGAADDPALQRRGRRLALACGDWRGFAAALRAQVPAALLADESNQLRGLWQALWSGPWSAVDDPFGAPDLALGLARALRDCGLPVEAELVASLAAERCAEPVVADLRDELRRELAFERALQQALREARTDPDGTLERLLADLREVSARVLGADVVGDVRCYEVPFVGRLVDPFGPGLPAWFRARNRHLVLGSRSGQPPEGMLLTRLSLRDLDDGDGPPETTGPLRLPGRAREVIGEDRSVDGVQGLLGGDLAGVALLDHYLVDLDAAKQWAADLVGRRRTVREDGGALLDDPLPDDAAALDPVDAAWRLAALSPVEDSAMLDAVLDTIRWHERAHLTDSFRFLPPERNLWSVFALLLRNGFGPLAVESEMEGRAELAALAFGRHPRVVLAHVAGFLGREPGGSPHARGFAELARRLNDALRRDPALATFARASRWHLAPIDRIQSTARRIAAGYWP
ncbi:MAG: hypothetical protein IPM29_12425 [Planctomycetes bacterium]|nr:hypothetical protein [Planctomycetota bacterium]